MRGAGAGLEDRARGSARSDPAGWDGAVESDERARVVEPEQVEREAHPERMDRSAAGQQEARAVGYGGEPGEAEGPGRRGARDEDEETAGEREAGEAGQARGHRRG
jgi:hypothetical protein